MLPDLLMGSNADEVGHAGCEEFCQVFDGQK